MLEEEIRESVMENLEKQKLDSKSIMELFPESEQKRVMFQLLILEKNKLVKRVIEDHNDPLLKSIWELEKDWKQKLENRPLHKKEQEILKLDTVLVATIPPEFADFEIGNHIIETRDALSKLLSSAKKEILISSPYIDEILRLYIPFIKQTAPKHLKIRLMTITQSDDYQKQRLQRLFQDIKNQFPNSEIILFENIVNSSERVIEHLFKTHAKIIIVDEEHLFVTSANLMKTSYLDNFEMGFVTTNKKLVIEAKRLYEFLVDKIKLINQRRS